MLRLVDIKKLNENKYRVNVQSTTSYKTYKAKVELTESGYTCEFDTMLLETYGWLNAETEAYLNKPETKNEVIELVKTELEA